MEQSLQFVRSMSFSTPMNSLVTLALLFVMGSSTACNESLQGVDSGSTPPSGVVRIQSVGSTQFQTTIVDTTRFPLRVRVMDESGRPVMSAVVNYEVIAGSGEFSSTRSVTNDQGFTQVLFRPLSVGAVIAEARVQTDSGLERQSFTFQVLNDPSIASQFEKVSGDNQTGAVGTVLPEPLVVRVINLDGGPVQDFPIQFAVQSPDSISAVVDPVTGAEGVQQTIMTDDEGFANAFVRLGTSPGTFEVRATAFVQDEGQRTTRTLSFTGVAVLSSNPAVRLLAVSGERQTVTLGTADSTDPTNFTPFQNPEQPNPLVVQALDRFGNPVPGATVFWHVADGGGDLNSATVVTDQNGFATNVVQGVTLGRNLIDAVASTTNRVTFVIEGVSTLEGEEERPGPGESGPSRSKAPRTIGTSSR